MWKSWLTVMELAEEDFRPDEHPRLCQRHFEQKDFLTRQLSGMAVPMRHLKRIRDKRISSVEECFSETVEQITADDNDAGSDRILDESVSYYEPTQEEFLDEVHMIQDDTCASPSPPKALVVAQPAFSCNIPQHKGLDDLLQVERARIKKLIKITAYQKNIIKEQRKLLLKLGVECVVQQQGLSSDDSA
uniref:THAP-type domain-containing protein n=1 Tax=Anopheles epiroticus TaxID=199890 RepID=A0A182PYQ1_9DIPT